MIMSLITIKIMIFKTNEVIFKNEFESIEFYYDNTPTNDIEIYIKQVNFSHFSEMINKTNSDIRKMTYEHYFKQQNIWLNLN